MVLDPFCVSELLVRRCGQLVMLQGPAISEVPCKCASHLKSKEFGWEETYTTESCTLQLHFTSASPSLLGTSTSIGNSGHSEALQRAQVTRPTR